MRLSWRQKLFLFAIIMALVPVAISSYNIIGIADQELKSSTNSELSSTALKLANDIDNFFKYNILDPLRLIKSGIERVEIGPEEKITFVYAGTKNLQDVLNISIFFKIDNNNLLSAINAAKDSVSLTYSGSYKTLLDSITLSSAELKALIAGNNEVVIGVPKYNAQLDDWILPVVVQAHIQGSPPAFLVATVRTGLIRERIKKDVFSKIGKLSVLDEFSEKILEGNSREKEQHGLAKEAVSFINSSSRLTAVKNYEESGAKFVGCYAFTQSVHWAVLARLKEEAAYSTVKKMSDSLSLWFVAGAVIALLGGIIFSRQISQPILKVSKTAEAISGGNFDIEAPYRGKDAIGVLGETLESMSKSLKKSFMTIEEQNRQLQEYNRTLEDKVAQRTAELKEKNEVLTETLTRLKETQQQLIMQQKLASLGQLTAGIAHEIRNPLNFVNNFAKLSKNLIEEIGDEIDKLEKQFPENDDINYIKELFEDVQTNMQKIAEHGKRADGIVGGMLQHSRNDAGQMQKSDFHQFVTESMNLAYHGMRSNTPDFNTKLDKILEADPSILVFNPQALSQVLVNIFNNSFYAMNKKQKQAGSGYQPCLTVKTETAGSFLRLTIRDNGTGIPANIREKIFEPFFTTKPTGEGTGLGLSLSFDIVSQMHKGNMAVNSEDGEFTEFVIDIPCDLTV